MGRLFGRGPRRRRVKLLFVTDMHGSEPLFRKLLKVLDLWSPDVLVCGGDVAGKGLWPVVIEGDTARVSVMGEEHAIPMTELEEQERRACQQGFYPHRVDQEGYQRLIEDDELTEQVFERLMYERWEDWVDRLDRRCGDLEIPAYVIGGNDDPWRLDEVLDEPRDWVHRADGEVVPLLDEWTLISCGVANETPWDCPRDVTEEEITERLEGMAAKVDSFDRVIANIHVPPHGYGLDVAPEVDYSTDPPRSVPGSTVPVGSTAVRDFLRERQPMVSLHGHIHESPGEASIGRTKAYNPGSEYAEGVLRGVLVVLEGDQVKGRQFVSG